MHSIPRTLLALWALVPLAVAQGHAVSAIGLGELELAEGNVLPRYAGAAPWSWSTSEAELPYALLDGEGECLFLADSLAGGPTDAFWLGRAQDPLGALVIRTAEARDVTGTLCLPRASGGGFTKLAFHVQAARATLGEEAFQAAELARDYRLLVAGVPGGAWFRHRFDTLRAELGAKLPAFADPRAFEQQFRPPDATFELFTGGRALYENLQLERGLPSVAGNDAPDEVALDTLEGITVRAFDWKERLGDATPTLDVLAAHVPADLHALFFPRFQGLVDVLDRADRLGGLFNGFAGHASDAEVRKRLETQLCLTLDELARGLGPLAIQSAAITGSDPYLSAGSDVAVLLEVRPEFTARVQELLRARQAAAGFVLEPAADGTGSLTRSPGRRISSHVFYLPSSEEFATEKDNLLVVTNSVRLSERLLAVARGQEPTLAASDEYRFFRRRYTLGAEDESAFLVLPDDAIRRWCSPRWRIGAARRVRAAAELAEEHAAHLDELAAGFPIERALGPDADFPELGVLRLGPDGVQSLRYGTLDFLTPIAELDLERVRTREADLYRRWRDGFQQAWSQYFDPIAARISVTDEGLALDLTVMPLILGTEYAELREATRGAGLAPGDGDPHDSALVHFAMALNRDWEPLKSIGQSLGPAAQKLGAEPLGWLGSWLSISLDDGPIWEDVLQAEGLDEALEFGQRLNEIPLVVTIAVAKPLQLALFLTALRSFVDGTAPGMTDWKERSVGERRFVEIRSPGLDASLGLLYATVPGALILSLNEEALLAAMQRAEERAAAATTGKPASSGTGDSVPGAHAALALHGSGFRLLETLLGDESARALREASWANLPILNEWKHRWPDADPVAQQARLFREHLVCPGGGEYAWNAEWGTMESSVFGHPGAPKPGVRVPPEWERFTGLRSRLTFEEEGLRVQLALTEE